MGKTQSGVDLRVHIAVEVIIAKVFLKDLIDTVHRTFRLTSDRYLCLETRVECPILKRGALLPIMLGSKGIVSHTKDKTYTERSLLRSES